MTPKYDPETILDNGGANDNDQTKTRTSAVAAARNSTAIAAIEALGAIVSNIDTAGYGSSSKPMLSFKSREGTWQIGHQRTIPEEGAPDPGCLADARRRLRRRLPARAGSSPSSGRC